MTLANRSGLAPLGVPREPADTRSSGPSSRRRANEPSVWRLLLFFVWLMVALLGEVGLVVSVAGVFARGVILWTAAQLAEAPGNAPVTLAAS